MAVVPEQATTNDSDIFSEAVDDIVQALERVWVEFPVTV
jgi:hypothetical protein